MKRLIFSFLFFLVLSNAWSQIVVNPGVSASALIAGFSGQGLTISNVSITCPTNAYGTFSNGATTNIGINNGAILTTGSATGVIGPNNAPNYGACNTNTLSDPDLTSIEASATNDPCIIEFDIVPQCNQLVVRFVFGSEEYPEYIHATYNDAFGFFISGPGPACQANYYTSTNVATLPDNVTPVSIHNVNTTTNSAYYVDNTGGSTIQYDGFTTVLTRTVDICPCQSYHFKIAIADAGDCNYDSGVLINFLQCNQAMAATTSATNAICGSNSGVASINMTNGIGPFTYTWSPSGGNASTATGLLPGTYTVNVDDAITCSNSYSAVVTVGNYSPIATPSTTNITCNGASDGIGVITTTGGVAPYTYFWSPGSYTTATVTGLAPGSYTITILDDNSCRTTATLNITDPPVLNSTTSQTDIPCNGGVGAASVSLSGGGPPYTYTWSPSGGNSAGAANLGVGTYTVRAKDANNCIVTKVFNITQPTGLSAVKTQTNLLCRGVSSGAASVAISGGTGAYSYTWSPSGGNGSGASGLSAGNYTVQIKDANNCPLTQTFNLTQPATSLAATTSQTNITCGSTSGGASVSASGGITPYTYTWNPGGANTTSVSLTTGGIYSITVQDANSCTLTKTLNIFQSAQLTVTAVSNNLGCNGSGSGSGTVNVSGGTSPYTYTWSPSGGNATTASSLAAGNYTINVKDALGCLSSASISIIQPPALTATTSQTNVLCNGGTGIGSASVSGGTSPYNYTWSPSGGNATTATLSAGLYTVGISDANGCLLSKTVNITQPGALTAATSQTNVACHGGSNATAKVTASGGVGPYTYTWAPSGGTTATAGSLSAGNYTVTVTDNNLCAITRTLAITEPASLVSSATTTSVNCNGQSTGSATVTVTGGTTPYSYTWTPSGGNTATASSLAAGPYTVAVKDASNCTTSSSVTIVQPSAMTATTSQVNVLCFGGIGAASIAVGGGISPYTYSWSPYGGNAATAGSLIAGTYTVTVNDANLCQLSRNYTITQPPLLTGVGTQSNVLCHGGSTGAASINVSGGTGLGTYAYTWSPAGGTTELATGFSIGNYTVTVRDNNFCTYTHTYTITEPPLLVSSVAGTSVSCFGQSTGSGTVTTTGGTPGYSYTWSPSGGNTATASALPANTYSIVIRDANGCLNNLTLNIYQPLQLTTAVGVTSVSCYNYTDGSATVTASGGVAPYNYVWTPSNATTSVISNLNFGYYNVSVQDANSCVTTNTTYVATPLQYTVDALIQNVLCHGESSGSATVVVSGNTPGYTYTWTPALSSNSIGLALSAGNYTVNILDSHNCPATKTLTVTEPPPFTASVTSSAANCGNNDGGGTVTATGGVPPYTYSWTAAGGTGSVSTGISTGEYTVVAMDFNNCQVSLTTSVAVINPSVFPSVASPTICSRTSTTLNATGCATYTWAPAAGLGSATGQTVAASPSVTTTYTVTGANPWGCTVEDTISIIVYPTPSLGLTASSTTVCAGGTISLSVTGADTYTWSPATGLTNSLSSNPVSLPPTQITYTVTGGTPTNVCVGSETITLNALPIPTVSIAASSTVICLNTIVVLTASGAVTYSWSGGTGASTVNPQHVVPATSMSYSVVGYDNLFGCTDTASVFITVKPSPVLSVSSPTYVCHGQSATLSASGAETYSWSTGATSPSISASPDSTQIYTVIGANANGCKDTAYVSMTVFKTPTITVSGKKEICKNEDVVLVAGGGTDYVWSTGDTTRTITYAFTTNTVLTVVSGSTTPCAPGSASVAITVDPLPTITATANPSTIHLGQTGQMQITTNATQNTTQFFWTPTDGLSCATCSAPTISASTSTVYTLEVVNYKGCINTTTVEVQVDIDCGDLFAPTAFSPNNDGNNDTWCVYGNCIKTISCEVFNRWGQKVFSFSDKDQCWDGHIGGTLQDPGVFIYRAEITLVTGESKSIKGNFTLVR